MASTVQHTAQAGNTFTGAVSDVMYHLAGNNVQGNMSINNINFGPLSDADLTYQCLSELFSTNPVDDRSKHIIKKGKAIEGTCSWISEHKAFYEWKHSRQKTPRLLWISGGPGTGKTMLSIHLTEELEFWTQSSQSVVLLYYFCDGQDPNSNTPVNILRGLIYQLIQNKKTLVKSLLEDYRVQKAKLFEAHSLEALWRILQTMIKESGYERVYCVIDGLDECNPQKIEAFLVQMRLFFDNVSSPPTRQYSRYRSVRRTHGRRELNANQSGETSSETNNPDEASNDPSFRLTIVSRNEPYLERHLGSFPHVPISSRSSKDTTAGFSQFLDAKAQHVSQATHSSESAGSIASALQQQGDGSFLWVDIATERLKTSGSNQPLNFISSLPTTIEGLYCQALLEIPPFYVSAAASILKWVALAARPLKVGELEIALRFDLRAPMENWRVLQTIKSCGSLLTIRKDEVTISQQTVKALLLEPDSALARDVRLQKFHVKQERGHSDITKICIQYLETVLRPSSSSARSTKSVKLLRVKSSNETPLSTEELQQLAQLPFLEYTVMNWPFHAKASMIGTQVFETPFFEVKSEARQLWLEIRWKSSHAVAIKYFAPSSFTLLHIAAYFGIVPLAVHIEQKGLLQEQLGIRNNYADRPLNCAIEQVQPAMARFLLDRGAKNVAPDVFDKNHSLAWEAATYGDAETLSLLLERGENPNQPFPVMNISDNWKMYASIAKRYIPRLLYECSEKAQAYKSRTSHYGYGDNETPLHAASVRGHYKAAEVLLNANAEVDSLTTGGWTPLHCASFHGKSNVISLLILREAKVDAETTQDRLSPLHLAAQEGELECTRKLLDADAHLEKKSSKGRTALHLASKRGHDAIVKLLLESGADIDAKSNGNITPLRLATFNGQESTVRVLLEYGADRSVKDDQGNTALDWAINKSYTSIAQMLGSNGPQSQLYKTEEGELGRTTTDGYNRRASGPGLSKVSSVSNPMPLGGNNMQTQSTSVHSNSPMSTHARHSVSEIPLCTSTGGPLFDEFQPLSRFSTTPDDRAAKPEQDAVIYPHSPSSKATKSPFQSEYANSSTQQPLRTSVTQSAQQNSESYQPFTPTSARPSSTHSHPSYSKYSRIPEAPRPYNGAPSPPYQSNLVPSPPMIQPPNQYFPESNVQDSQPGSFKMQQNTSSQPLLSPTLLSPPLLSPPTSLSLPSDDESYFTARPSRPHGWSTSSYPAPTGVHPISPSFVDRTRPHQGQVTPGSGLSPPPIIPPPRPNSSYGFDASSPQTAYAGRLPYSPSTAQFGYSPYPFGGHTMPVPPPYIPPTPASGGGQNGPRSVKKSRSYLDMAVKEFGIFGAKK